MEKDLEQTRQEWEVGLEPKCVLDFEHKTVVILEDDDGLFHINRYFLLGNEWTCSVDQNSVGLDKIFECLEFIIK